MNTIVQRATWLLAAAVLSCPVFSWADETDAALWLTIDGELIEGENDVTSLDREGTIKVLDFGNSGAVPIQLGSGVPIGAVSFQAFTIVKNRDKSTPLLYKALTNSENVTTAEFRFYKLADSRPVHSYTITLSNARINAISVSMGQGNSEPTEAVSFYPQTIKWVDEGSGAQHQWSWVDSQ